MIDKIISLFAVKSYDKIVKVFTKTISQLEALIEHSQVQAVKHKEEISTLQIKVSGFENDVKKSSALKAKLLAFLEPL